MANNLLQKAAPYMSTIQEAAAKNGIPAERLAAVLAQESAFNPKAVSGAGAQGIAQFMPGTAKEYGIDPFDPTQAINASAQYMGKAYKEFGNWEQAHAAYNAGFGNARNGKYKRFKETMNYIPAIDRYTNEFASAFGGQPMQQVAQVDPNNPQQPQPMMAMAAQPQPNGVGEMMGQGAQPGAQQPQMDMMKYLKPEGGEGVGKGLGTLLSVLGSIGMLGGTAANIVGGFKGMSGAGNAGLSSGASLLTSMKEGKESGAEAKRYNAFLQDNSIPMQYRQAAAMQGSLGNLGSIFLSQNKPETAEDKLDMAIKQETLRRAKDEPGYAEKQGMSLKQKQEDRLYQEQKEEEKFLRNESAKKDLEIWKQSNVMQDPKTSFDVSQKIRKEFEDRPAVKEYMQLRPAKARIDSVWQDYLKNPEKAESKNALDQVIVIGFNKILDPGSVVRESEFARTPEGISAINRVQGFIQKQQKGGVGLTDNTRREVINAIDLLVKGQEKEYSNIKKFYKDEALRTGIAPERVIGILEGGPEASGAPAAEQPVEKMSTGAPKPNTVEDGYRYLGGDPSKQTSWEKVK